MKHSKLGGKKKEERDEKRCFQNWKMESGCLERKGSERSSCPGARTLKELRLQGGGEKKTNKHFTQSKKKKEGFRCKVAGRGEAGLKMVARN